MQQNILILGSGPTGLGSSFQLLRCNSNNWTLLEAEANPGGLSSSFIDAKGFTWDIGGHVQFSHYDYFDQVMQKVLGEDGWYHHLRDSSVWMRERFIPYPLQNNFHDLPTEDLNFCLQGLNDIIQHPKMVPSNFQEWIDSKFGRGLAEVFMEPYNFKVWAYPPEMLNTSWMGDRVAVSDPETLVKNIGNNTNDSSWGPNTTFQFPKRGGSGAIWRSLAGQLPQDNLHFNTKVVRINLKKKRVYTKDGREYDYEYLISTLPLIELINISGQTQFMSLAKHGLLFSSSNIFGLGLYGKLKEELKTKCWIYFPENNCPFYRVTIFSNYSPFNVPDIKQYWSIILEVSESIYRPINQEQILKDVIQGALNVKLIERAEDIVSTWQYRAEYGYPTPGLYRDEALLMIIPFFEDHQVFSRGRFGMWKYEVSNQDHSFMQGVEIVERLLHGKEEITAFNSNYANSQKHPWPFKQWQVCK